jgi:hypothetical protein
MDQEKEISGCHCLIIYGENFFLNTADVLLPEFNPEHQKGLVLIHAIKPNLYSCVTYICEP